MGTPKLYKVDNAGKDFVPCKEEPPKRNRVADRVNLEQRIREAVYIRDVWWCIALWNNSSSAYHHRRYLELAFPQYEFAAAGYPKYKLSKLYIRLKPGYATKTQTRSKQTSGRKGTAKSSK